MPTQESLFQKAEDSKKQGNQAFQKGDLKAALTFYSQGIVTCDRLATPLTADARKLKATLLSNRCMCNLKAMRFQPCIDDCTTALDDSLDPAADLRVKLWFRRAKAQFLLTSIVPDDDKSKKDALLQDAAKDLLQLLQQDATNKEATTLLHTIRAVHKTTGSKAATPVSQTLQALKAGVDDEAQVLKQTKLLLGLLDNDMEGVSMELGRIDGTIQMLLSLATRYCNIKAGVLVLQLVSRAAGHPAFVQRYLHTCQKDLAQVIVDVAGRQENDSSELIVSVLAAMVRIVLHADRDDPKEEISGATKIDYNVILDSCRTALDKCPNDKLVLRGVLDVLSTWTCGTEREAAARSSLGHVTDPTLPIPKTAADIRGMTAQELAAHRKRQSETKQRDLTWAYERSMMFCGQQSGQQNSAQNGIRTLLRAACACDDHVVRRELTVTLGRVLSALDGDDDEGKQIKEVVAPLLSDMSKKDHMLTIEEVYNEDEEEAKQAALEEENNVPLEKKMEHALITASLLLSRKEVGAWALGTGWKDSSDELPELIESDNPRAMCTASEVLSGAATVETARPMVANLVTSGAMSALMMCDDRDIRSGAASAVTKLGLSAKETDEAEKIGLLQAACDLLEDRGDESLSKEDRALSEKLHRFNSHAGSSVERAIEMLTYLVANTDVKEELAAGFRAPGATGAAIERLVEVSDFPAAGESLAGFGLASIFHLIVVTNHQLRKESFEGREVTMEQYDEMQRMGKTEEEKDLMDLEEDPDTKDLCNERIRKLANANVPRALVTLTEGASEHTLEQLAFTMNRMAEDQSTRGVLIQQGVLSACIKIEKKEGPTETDTMKKIIRLSRHCIAKLLVTTNPSLLTSAQRLGSVRPLVQLVRDIKASDLQQFEALLALTNIAGSGEDGQNRIVSEKGIGAFHFAMFSDHELVRRAATETMCNLVPHEDMMKHLTEVEHLRLWAAFAADYEDHYECARAATGCLAMATQEEEIAISYVDLDKFRETTTSLLESGRLEIMHRAMAMVLNLVAHGGETKKKAISEGIVAFCKAYVDTYNADQHPAEVEFTAEERALLPVTVDLAKKIVSIAEQ